MNTVTFSEDIRFHTGFPLVGAMSKMNTTLKQGFHRNDSHLFLLTFAVLQRAVQRLTRNGMSLVGINTHSRTLIARPRQDMWRLWRHGGIISQKLVQLLINLRL